MSVFYLQSYDALAGSIHDYLQAILPEDDSVPDMAYDGDTRQPIKFGFGKPGGSALDLGNATPSNGTGVDICGQEAPLTERGYVLNEHRGLFEALLNVPWDANRRYYSDVLVCGRGGDAIRLSELVNERGRYYKGKLFWISIHDDHIHVIHDCPYSNGYVQTIEDWYETEGSRESYSFLVLGRVVVRGNRKRKSKRDFAVRFGNALTSLRSTKPTGVTSFCISSRREDGLSTLQSTVEQEDYLWELKITNCKDLIGVAPEKYWSVVETHIKGTFREESKEQELLEELRDRAMTLMDNLEDVEEKSSRQFKK